MAGKASKQGAKKGAPKTIPERYEKEEFIAASQNLFGVQRECVVAALRGTDGPLTIEEATQKLNEFMNMEVK